METNMVSFLTKNPFSSHITPVSLRSISSSKLVFVQQRYALPFHLKSGSTIYGKLTHAGDGSERGRGGGQTKNKNKCYSFGLSVLTDGQGVIYYPAQSVLYTCLYNIFLNVEAVHRLVFSSSRLSLLLDSFFFLSWHLLGGLLSALVVSVMFCCSQSSQSVPARAGRG